MAQKRIDIYCMHCGSRNVRRDADVIWNVGAQRWEIAGIYDNATCDDCGGETKLDECELAPQPEA